MMEKKEYDRERLLQYATFLLARHTYTVKTLREKLASKCSSDAIIKEVLEEMMEAGYLDDEAYLRWYIESRKEKYGMYRIKRELLNKGIDPFLLEDYLEGVWQEEDIVYKLGRKKFDTYRIHAEEFQEYKFRLKVKDRLMNHLINRGFSYSESSAAVNRIFSEFISSQTI